MRNVKMRLKGGRTLIRRLPRHSRYELDNLPTTAEKLRRRSKSRAANKQARLARRVTHHGR